MTTYALFSDAARDAALALIGEEYLAETAPGLQRQILKAVCGGDSDAVNAVTGGTGLGTQETQFYKQILVALGQ
jgi:hypothetical protein